MFSIPKIAFKYLLAFIFIFCLYPSTFPNISSTLAQTGATTGTLVGLIKDSTNAVISGAKITARQIDTNFTQEITSQGNGSYIFVQLPPGKYEILVQADGFMPAKEPLVLTLGTTALMDFLLQVEGNTGVIEVIADQGFEPKTESSTNIEQERIVTLPSSQRNFLELSIISPRITNDRLPNNGVIATSGLSANAQSARFNNITIDGLDNNDHTSGSVRSVFGQDGIQEFQVITDGYSTEFGRVLGAVVNIVTRGGGNQFHNESFFTSRNEEFAARDTFAATKPPLEKYQFGTLLSGPIKRDKAFIFTAFERLTAKQSNIVNLTPDAVVAARLEGIKLKVGPVPFAIGSTSLLTRFDTQLSPNSTLWIRYNGGFTYNGSFQNFGGLIEESSGGIQKLSDNTIAASNTYISSSLNLVNEARLLFGRRNQDILPIANKGLQIQLASIEGNVLFGRNIFLPQEREENIYQFVDNVVLPRANHTVKFGVDLFYTDLRKFSIPALKSGAAVFTRLDTNALLGGDFPGVGTILVPFETFSPRLRSPDQIQALKALSAILPNLIDGFPQVPLEKLPIPLAFSQSFGDSNGRSNYKFLSAYIQDEVKIRPNILLKAGLRYDLNVVKFSPDTKLSFSPRLAIAYQPLKFPKLNIKAAYGIFVGSPLAGVILTSEVSGRLKNITFPLPFSILAYDLSKRNLLPETNDIPQDIITTALFFRQFSQNFAINRQLRNSYAQQATLSIDYSLDKFSKLSLSYNYVRGIKLFGSRDINPIVRPVPRLQPGSDIDSFLTGRVDPDKGSIFQLESAFDSNYHAFTALIDRRFGQRFGLLAHYTFSKAIDNTIDFFPLFQEIANPLQPGLERGLSIQDVSNRLVISGVVDLTYSKNPLLRDYRLSSIININSGRPYNLLAGVDLDRSGDFPPADRPLGIGRNTGITPGFASVDLRLTRSFSLRENYRVQAFIEAFNLFNRVNIDPNQINRIFLPDPNTRMFLLPPKENGRFSLPEENVRGAFSPRQIQLGLRLSF
ncbi:MAG: TonB-dependent receptor [Acidobacteria bacterium]|nr:TonB-dependent receptor [Acidobacteriota bacterium]